MITRKLSKLILVVVLLLSAAAYSPSAFTPAANNVISSVACHTANIFYEARGESKEGMQAVAKVVVNRTTSGKYPKNTCMVIFQKKQFSWTHQQDFKDIQKVLNADLSGFNAKDRQAFADATLIAQKAVKGQLKVLPKDALWYHSVGVSPKWKAKMKKVKQVGQHIFYVKL